MRRKRIIHWVRRDLRITDNTALADAVARGEEVIPVYVMSDWHGTHHWTGSARQEFLCGSLAVLSKNLEFIGGRLIIRRGDAVQHVLAPGTAAVFLTPDSLGNDARVRV